MFLIYCMLYFISPVRLPQPQHLPKDLLADREVENMASPKSKSNALSTRSRLLQAASILFYEQGYAATTLAQISEKSGVNNGLITYYFGSKNNLASEIYNLYLMNIRAEISRQLFLERKEFSMELGIAVEQRVSLALKLKNPNLLRFDNEYHKDRVSFTSTNDRRERYYDLQKMLINPDISDIDLKLYSICGIAVVRIIAEAYEKNYLSCDVNYLKDYVIRTLFTMLQLPHQRIEALIAESRKWESRVRIKVGPFFQVSGGTE